LGGNRLLRPTRGATKKKKSSAARPTGRYGEKTGNPRRRLQGEERCKTGEGMGAKHQKETTREGMGVIVKAGDHGEGRSERGGNFFKKPSPTRML